MRLHPSLIALSLTAVLTACDEPPIAGTATITPENPTTIDDLTLNITSEAEDPNGDDLTQTVAWFRNGEEIADLADAMTVPADRTARGEDWVAKVYTSDGWYTTGFPWASVRIENSPPVVVSLVGNTSPASTEDLLVDFVAEDPDGDTLTGTYSWTRNGTVVEQATGDRIPARQTALGDTWVATLIVSDGITDSEPQTLTFGVGNSPPSILEARLVPEEPDVRSTLVCQKRGWFDADGDPEGYTYAWRVNGSALPIPDSQDTLTSDFFARGDEVQCLVTPTDGVASGTAQAAPSVTIRNAIPTMSPVSISPEVARVTDTLTVNYLPAVDPDGDLLSYAWEWRVNDVPTATTETLPPGSFVKGDTVQAAVRVNDTFETSPRALTEVITIANSAPVVTSVSLSPLEVRTNDVISYTYGASDPDGDKISEVSVEWYVNGVLHSTGPTLDGSTAFSKNDEIYAIVKASDGEEFGEGLKSDTITVLNTVPTTPGIAFNYPRYEPNEDVDCTVTTPSVDADGDAITYDFKWYHKGLPYSGPVSGGGSGLVETFPDGILGVGDRIQCTVTPSDGTNSGGSTYVIADTFTWAADRTLTNCGKTGYEGPTSAMCLASYNGSREYSETSVTSGFQKWTVPFDGTYLITAYGAQGWHPVTSTYKGGLGARIGAEFSLKAGDTLEIIVGQHGTTDGCSSGGGGGSFVYGPRGSVMLAAGGGGGLRVSAGKNGCPGTITENGTVGSGSSPTGGCSPSSSTIKLGGAVSGSTWGSGGAGVSGDGATDTSGKGGGSGGKSYASGWVGGGSTSVPAFGGFGGGGSGNGSCGGGGGGGYSGGGGGFVGGGGGSFSSGTKTSSTAYIQSGHGRVVIRRLGP